MTKHSWSVVCLAAALSLSGGCTEYYTVDSACHEKGKFVGMNALGPTEVEAFNRLNCYRRLSGILRATVNADVQAAAAGQAAYILANPDVDRYTGQDGEDQYLSQRFDEQGFTGANVFERLDTAGYQFIDPRGTAVQEYIKLIWDEDGENLPTGALAMDYLFRDHEFRQYGLQPSWIDGGYTEADLSRDWFVNGEFCKNVPDSCSEEGEAPPNLRGRLYYMVLVHDSPHIEHADRPVVYPKRDQTQVPLWSESENLAAIDIIGKAVDVQISYPITIFGGVIDSANANLGEQNMYGLDVIASIVHAQNGPLETQVILPATAAEKVYPAGTDHRQIASIFTREPFEPSTTYQLYADVTTTEASFTVDITFTTAPEDPGLELADTSYTTSASARLAPDRLEALLEANPHMVRRSTR